MVGSVGRQWGWIGWAAALLVAAMAGLPARVARAGELPDLRDARGFNLGDDRQHISPGEEVSLFNGTPSYHRTLLSWPEPGGVELEFTLDYSGAVPHHRFDFTTGSTYVDSEEAFGEWSLGLNGHVLWTGNLSGYLFNGEIPGQPHRDGTGLVVDGCWRTCGFSICDKAYSGGGANADVELATSDGGSVEFGYPGNVPYTSNPVMLPNDRACAWRASLAPPASTGRTLRVKKPDGTSWAFDEVPLTLRWPGYYYNSNQGPRAFRLARIDGPTPEFSATVSYEYADSGSGRAARLHPTAVHVTDQLGRQLDLVIDTDASAGTCQVTVQNNYQYPSAFLSFSAGTYVDRAHHTRRSSLYYLDSFVDRIGRTIRFRHEADDRADASVRNCSDSMDVRARRLVGVTYATGGTSTYSYLPLPSQRPGCPDPSLRFEDSSWRLTGRSTSLAPVLARVELREAAGQAPTQTLDFAYGWNAPPPVGGASESEAYRYTTTVAFNAGPPQPQAAQPGPGGLPGKAPALRGVQETSGSFSVLHVFRKFPYLPQTFGGPAPYHWAPRLASSSVQLRSGETHTLAVDYDAVPQGGVYAGTLLPATRTCRVNQGAMQAQYATFTEYDSLARVTAVTDLAGVRQVTEYFDSPELHSPWSGTGRYSVLLPGRQRRLAPPAGALLSETWYDREPVYGRTVAVHVRQDPGRVSTTVFQYDPDWPSRVRHSIGAMGEVVDYHYETCYIPNTFYFADGVGSGLPVHTVLHPDASHTLEVYQSYEWEGRLLREADGLGRISVFTFDEEGRPRTVARPGDVMTGPPPPPGPQAPGVRAPALPPYDLTPWASTVITYFDKSVGATVRTALYPSMHDSLRSVSEIDGLGRQRTTYASRNPAARRDFEYDSFGRTVRVAAPGSQVANYGYDELGRPVEVSGAVGGTTTWARRTATGLEADGLHPPFAAPAGFWTVETRRSPGGRAALRAYDARGLLAVVADYGPGSAVPEGVSFYESDAAGQLAAVYGPDGSVTRLDYDLAGHRRHVLQPDGSRLTTVYDLSGRAVFVQDGGGAAGREWAYFRLDGVGRLLEQGRVAGISEADAQSLADRGAPPAGARWTARYTYDSGPDPNAPGCLVRAEARSDSGRVDACDYTCDQRKRVVSKTLTFDGLARGLTVGYEYDRLDRLTALTYPDGRRIELSYDAAVGRLARIGEPATGRTLMAVSRDAAGRAVLQSNGPLNITWDYGPTGLLTSQAGRALGRTLFQESLERDADGRCSARVGPGGARADYERDAQARLSAVRFSLQLGRPGAAYGYAVAGGLDSVASALENLKVTLSGPRALELLRRPLGREALEYDPRGNVARRTRMVGADTLGVLELAYDADGRLVSVSGRAGEVTASARYGYDADGLRVRREVAGTRSFEVRDEHGDLLAEVDSAGRVIRDYVRADGRVVGVLEADGAYVAYLSDATGSVRLGVDERGAVRFRQEFLPYGEPVSFEGEARPALGFLGAERDPETGYCYLKSRYYDPEIGRFLTPDPLRDGGAAPYAYGLDDPLDYSDPEGLAASPVDEPVHIPTYSLPMVTVRATHGVPAAWLVALRMLRTVSGNRADEQAVRLYHGCVAVARLWRQVRDGSFQMDGRKLVRAAAGGLRRHLPAAPRVFIKDTLNNTAVTHTLDRAMVTHELIAATRVMLALDRARSLTPQEREIVSLKAEAVLLGETTADLLAMVVVDLGMAHPAAGATAFLTWGGVRGDISDLSDGILGRTVPGYSQTSVLDELFGPLLSDPPAQGP